MLRIAKKLVNVCLHFSKAVQISLQFDEFFDRKIFKILISRRFEIFTKTSHLVGTPCKYTTMAVFEFQIISLHENPN